MNTKKRITVEWTKNGDFFCLVNLSSKRSYIHIAICVFIQLVNVCWFLWKMTLRHAINQFQFEWKFYARTHLTKWHLIVSDSNSTVVIFFSVCSRSLHMVGDFSMDILITFIHRGQKQSNAFIKCSFDLRWILMILLYIFSFVCLVWFDRKHKKRKYYKPKLWLDK